MAATAVSPATTVADAPSAAARSSFFCVRLTAITCAPRARAICTVASPTPPIPKTATHSPGRTRA